MSIILSLLVKNQVQRQRRCVSDFTVTKSLLAEPTVGELGGESPSAWDAAAAWIPVSKYQQSTLI